MNYRICMMLIGSKSGKNNGRKTQILEKISRDCLVLGTGNALFSCFDQVSYFDHNVLISDPI